MVSTPTIRNAIAIGGVCCASSSSVSAFTSTPSLQKSAHNLKSTTTTTTTTTLYQQRNSPGFVGFQSDDNPIRGGGGGSPNNRRSMDDPFAPSPRMQNGPPHRSEPRRSWEQPPQIDLNGQIQDRQSNLAYNRQSINEDPRQFDMDRRFSQRPARGMPGDPSMEPTYVVVYIDMLLYLYVFTNELLLIYHTQTCMVGKFSRYFRAYPRRITAYI